MNVIELSVSDLVAAPWNANKMDNAMMTRLRESIGRYGMVGPLVVRPVGRSYEVLSGNQRLKALLDMGFTAAPCVVVEIDDAAARLLAQAMNDLHGEDDLAAKGEILKTVLETVPQDDVLSLLPETVESLKALTSITRADMAQHLLAWQGAQAARLRHVQLQLTDKQLEVVEEAVALMMPSAAGLQDDNPNLRSRAIYLLCRYYLERRQPE